MKRVICLLFLLVAAWLRGAEESSIMTPDGRVRLFGPDPRMLQEVAVWAVRGIRTLERETGHRVPYQAAVPLMIRFVPDLEQSRLLEEMRGTHLWQEILTPAGEAPDAVGLADLYTRAALNRLLWQAAPGAKPEAPDWLVMGISHVLLDDLSSTLLAEGLSLWREGRLSSPTSLTRAEGAPSLTEAARSQRAHALLAYRFLRFLHPDASFFWEKLGRNPYPAAADWIQAPGAGDDLRDLHIAWDLWLSVRDRSAIADLADGDRATERLELLLRLRVGEYGLSGDNVPRYETLRLPDLVEHLREPWVESLLQAWTVRAHLLRFRQGPAFLERVDHYTRAAKHLLEANQAKGRSREEALIAFEAAYRAGESLRPLPRVEIP